MVALIRCDGRLIVAPQPTAMRIVPGSSRAFPVLAAPASGGFGQPGR